MDINDIVMISIYNYVSDNNLEYNDMYEKLCSDIASYIENNFISIESSLDQAKTIQFVMQFLSVEMNLEKFIQIEQQIMDMNINDDIIDQDNKLYNTKISHEIIKVYKNIDQEKMIIDILNNINFNQKIKSR